MNEKFTPKADMVLCGFSGVFTSAYFDTFKELELYIKDNDTSYGSICTIEYFRSLFGQSDVIKQSFDNGCNVFLSVSDVHGYLTYNYKESIKRDEDVWEYCNGSIRDIYSAFRDRGVVFEHDVYADTENKKFIKIINKIKKGM